MVLHSEAAEADQGHQTHPAAASEPWTSVLSALSIIAAPVTIAAAGAH